MPMASASLRLTLRRGGITRFESSSLIGGSRSSATVATARNDSLLQTLSPCMPGKCSSGTRPGEKRCALLPSQMKIGPADGVNQDEVTEGTLPHRQRSVEQSHHGTAHGRREFSRTAP